MVKITHYVNRFVTILREEGVHGVFQKGSMKVERLLHPEIDKLPSVRVSVIIPVYNAVNFTKNCLQNLYDNTDNSLFNVIVINNGSKDNTRTYLRNQCKIWRNLNVIDLETNIGFGPAVNLGFQRSNSEYAVILNNDTIVTPNWLENLVYAMDNNPEIGIASPVTNFVGEGSQVDENAKNLSPDPKVLAEFAKSINTNTEIELVPRRLVFFCVILKREVLDLLGYLDEGYVRGNYEDDDLCLRARLAGYKLGVIRNSFVYHHGSVTFKKNLMIHQKWMEKNKIRFFEKAGRISISPSINEIQMGNNSILLSIIVRTKDRPQTLQRALQSLANQTFKDFEVVLVNDGGRNISTIVNTFQQYFPIRYIFNPQSVGRTKAINLGLEQAQGKWIGYLDDDDIVYPWHYDTLINSAGKHNASFVYSDFNFVLFDSMKHFSPIRLVSAKSWDYDKQELLIQNYMPIHTYIHLKELIQQTGKWYENLDRLEDYDFLLRIKDFANVYHVKELTCEYRYYLDSMNSIFQGRNEYLNALKEIYSRYPVTDDEINVKRKTVLQDIEQQSKKIQGLLDSAEDDETNQKKIRRDIINIVVGF